MNGSTCVKRHFEYFAILYNHFIFLFFNNTNSLLYCRLEMSKFLDILGDNSIPVKTEYVLTVTKDNFKTINYKKHNDCKILKFSHDLSFIEVLKWISKLDAKDYPTTFIFIIDLTKADDVLYINILKRFLIIFDESRSLILQLTLRTDQKTKWYYKKEGSKTFEDIVEHQTSGTKDCNSFSSFLWRYLNRTVDLESLIDKSLRDIKNSSLIFKFVQTLKGVNEDFLHDLVMKCAEEGSVSDLLAAVDGYLDDKENICGNDIESYFSKTFNSTSVLMKAILHQNKPIVEFLIKKCSIFIQQLPFHHQLEISTQTYKTNKFNLLCDLIEQADFPFPDNLNSELITCPKLKNIIYQRTMFHSQIQDENLSEIIKFSEQNPNIKFLFNVENKTALTQALESKKYKSFYSLKSLRFCELQNYDDLFLNAEDMILANRIKTTQRIENANVSSCNKLNSVLILQTRSFIYSRNNNSDKQIEQRAKIREWLEDIYKTRFGSKLIDAAAQCEELKIVFDFESFSVSICTISSLFTPITSGIDRIFRGNFCVEKFRGGVG